MQNYYNFTARNRLRNLNMNKPLISKALEANLAETRYRDIFIPQEYLDFIKLSADYFGITKRAHDCITEFHHPLSNRKLVIEELREILITDFWFYTKDSIPLDALELPVGMMHKMLSEDISKDLKSSMVQTLLELISLLIKNEAKQKTVIDLSLDVLQNKLNENIFPYIISSRYFVRNLNAAADNPEYAERVIALTKSVLHECYSYWRTTSLIEEWVKTKQESLGNASAMLEEHLGATYFNSLFEKLQQFESWDDLISYMPLYDDIADRFANSVELLDQFIIRFYFTFYLLHLPGMQIVKERLLWSLDKMIRKAVDELNETELLHFVDLLFDLATELKEEHTSSVLDFIQTLGLKVIELDTTERKEYVNYFEKKLIDFGFVSPGMIFVDNDWQLSVNTNHIKNIRVWLQLIEDSQSEMEKLLSALIVNLQLGGIFISDTDLFQREITKILNSNIAPYYKKVKQLTRIFPVFFNEIGAEGEIRKVTTTMDEISGRQDKLIHFLRKQVHTESNNTLIDLTLRIFQFWYDGNLEALHDYLPQNVYSEIDKSSEWFAPVHEMVNELCRLNDSDPEGLLMLSVKEFDRLLQKLSQSNQRDVERLRDIHSLYAHLREKYSFESVNIVQLLHKHPFIPEEDITLLDKALKANDYKKSLSLIYSFMERLKSIIFDPAESEGWENIYHKRHIAIGIPSMYGMYRENKFEALGLTFRLERVATRLMEKVVENINLDYISATTLEEINIILEYFREGLELDGISNQSFNSNLQMLRYSLTSRSFSFDQYINIFQFLAQDIRRTIIKYFLKSYEYPLKVIVPQLFDPENELSDKELLQLISKKSEEFHRDVIAEAFLVQPLDNFVSRILQSLRSMADRLNPSLISDIMSYNKEIVISPLGEHTEKMDNQVFLGSKAYHLKNLLLNKFPVPPGFVITTEVFRRNNTIHELPALRKELHELFRKHLSKMEKQSGRKFGDPKKPLLLSVRSGTAISMPGAMDTILNVGLNDQLVEQISKLEPYSWSIWDSYRRLLQSWGMAHGIERDVFDDVMIRFKKDKQILQKLEFKPEELREMTMAYKQVLADYNVEFEENLFKQLIKTINIVFDSWSSERAYVYRKHLQIADNWGTAVIVQQMIFGNLSNQSGTGVIFTQNPRRERPGVHLYGDFTMRSQGEDIVAGLVKPYPVSETQRIQNNLEGMSLQTMYPKIYKRLYEIAKDLTENHGYSPQEIEFTFESEEAEDLHILQTRDQDLNVSVELNSFTVTPDEMQLLGRGIGIGGGAMNGIAAFDEEDLEMLREKYPDENLLLIRPDTVPDDIGMIFACDGLITARGGATSHAAVTAVRLGKTCVVNCTDLVVQEAKRCCQLGNHTIYSGDKVAIDGNLGNIYLGHYPIEKIIDTSEYIF